MKNDIMDNEQLSNLAAKEFNLLGNNPPHYHWMDGFVAGYKKRYEAERLIASNEFAFCEHCGWDLEYCNCEKK